MLKRFFVVISVLLSINAHTTGCKSSLLSSQKNKNNIAAENSEVLCYEVTITHFQKVSKYMPKERVTKKTFTDTSLLIVMGNVEDFLHTFIGKASSRQKCIVEQKIVYKDGSGFKTAPLAFQNLKKSNLCKKKWIRRISKKIDAVFNLLEDQKLNLTKPKNTLHKIINALCNAFWFTLFPIAALSIFFPHAYLFVGVLMFTLPVTMLAHGFTFFFTDTVHKNSKSMRALKILANIAWLFIIPVAITLMVNPLSINLLCAGCCGHSAWRDIFGYCYVYGMLVGVPIINLYNLALIDQRRCLQSDVLVIPF